MKSIHRFSIVIIILCLLFILGCDSDKKPSAQAEVKPQNIKICSTLGKNITELLVKDFVKQSKIKVIPTIEYVPGGTLEQRLAYIEKGNFDCWLGGTAEEYYTANGHKLLAPYTSKEAFKVPLELRNRRNLWTSLYLSHIAIISNKTKLRNLGLYAPTTWAELLDPHLKDQIVIPNFNLGGSSFGMLTSIWQLRGKEAALVYAGKLNQQQPLYVNSPIEAADAVYKGEKTLAIVDVGYALELEEKHSHLFATVPKDANRNLITGVALLNNAKNEESAQLFIDYLMSNASEALLHNNHYNYLWHVKEYPNNSGRTELVGKLNFPMDDLAWTSTYKSEIIRQWTEAK